jgi:alpha-mannosidase
LAPFSLPKNWGAAPAKVMNEKKEEILSQVVSKPDSDEKEILFQADVPSVGYNTYQLEKTLASPATGASVLIQTDGTYKIETDLYKIILDPSKGGTIKGLVAKNLDNKEFVDAANTRSFDEIRWGFYGDGGFHSSADGPAEISVLENGPIRVRMAIKGRSIPSRSSR